MNNLFQNDNFNVIFFLLEKIMNIYIINTIQSNYDYN